MRKLQKPARKKYQSHLRSFRNPVQSTGYEVELARIMQVNQFYNCL